MATSQPAASYEVVTSMELVSGNITPRPSGQATVNTKDLTCHFWASGWCRYTEDQCLYAHHQTGKVAQEPSQKEEGRPSVAGKNASRQIPMYTNWRLNRAQNIGPQIQQQLHHIQAKAQDCIAPNKYPRDYTMFNVQRSEPVIPRTPMLSHLNCSDQNFGAYEMDSTSGSAGNRRTGENFNEYPTPGTSHPQSTKREKYKSYHKSAIQNTGYIPNYHATYGSNEQAMTQIPGYASNNSANRSSRVATKEHIKDGIVFELSRNLSDTIAYLRLQDQIIAEEAHTTLRIIESIREGDSLCPTGSHNVDSDGKEKASDEQAKPPYGSKKSSSKRLMSSVETTMSRLAMNRQTIQSLEQTQKDIGKRLEQVGEGRLLPPSWRQVP